MPTTDATVTIGLTELAVMGRNLARDIAPHGHPVAVRQPRGVDDLGAHT
ncbi:MAG: hypothetical protein JWM84_2214 [Nocardioides sp.]|nr:hypothetical protein [Nocardioides sp.]